jgi:2-pyrone-4,6-dicarboxylate lactonase
MDTRMSGIWKPSFNYVPTFAAPPDALLAAMDRVGVDYAILVQPSIYGSDHRFLFNTVGRHQDRFLPLGLLDPSRRSAPRDAATLIGRGCVGFRVNLSLDAQEAASQTAHRFWAELESLGVPVCVRATPEHHGLVLGILTSFPGLTVVIDHLELPDPGASDEAIERLVDLAGAERCLLKVAGLARLSTAHRPYRDLWQLVEAALELFGSSRLLWGSDFPGGDTHFSYVDELEAMEAMPFISPGDRRIVMAETSRRLWGEPAR